MVEEVFSEGDICSVRWDEQVGAVILEWVGDVNGDTYREYMDRTLDVIVDKQADKCLVDRQNQGRMTEADQEWTVEDWDVRAFEAGLAYLAIVYPEDPSAKTTVDMAARKSPFLELERVFTRDPEEARSWLLTK
jgi:hypothetical protein